jgi:RNA polymerase sigma-70 factor, ECF subfamily
MPIDFSSGSSSGEKPPGTDLRPSSPSGSTMSPQEFGLHFRTSARMLWLIAVGIVGDTSEAEDVVQEAAMVAYRKLDQFQPGTSFRAWSGTIVRNVALNTLRSTRRRRGTIGDLFGVNQSSTALNVPESSDSTSSAEKMLDSRVAGALADLGDVARACLLLRTVGELHYSEIASLLAIPEGTAMSHVHRARACLRERLAPVWADMASRSGGHANP